MIGHYNKKDCPIRQSFLLILVLIHSNITALPSSKFSGLPYQQLPYECQFIVKACLQFLKAR